MFAILYSMAREGVDGSVGNVTSNKQRTFVSINNGSTKAVSSVERVGKARRNVYVETHAYYSRTEAAKNRLLEMNSRQRCLDFFQAMPDLVIKERWIPISNEAVENDDIYVPVKSVREYVAPIADDHDTSSLGQKGIPANSVTSEMKAQIEKMVGVAKEGILQATNSQNVGKPLGLVPDLRGENFIFNEQGELKFVDTSSLDECALRTEVVLSSGLRSALVKIIAIERKYLDRASIDLWNDQKYQLITSNLRDRIGDQQAREQLKIEFGFDDRVTD
jgi:hypothetical protein